MARFRFILMPLAILCSSPVLAQKVQDVEFSRGSTGTSITGSITGRNFIDYRIRLGVGQMFSVNMRVLGGTPYFNVLEPGSTVEAIFVGSRSGNQFEVRTGRAGVYTIRVYQMRSSERRGETARFTLNISARTGSGGAAGASRNPPFHSRDALVPGTPYHATALIRCVAEPGQPMKSCKAGVIRRATTATVHIDTPDGGERNILFRDGKAVSSDSQSTLSVSRRGDISMVRIGRYEAYEIPDALIFGG